ncbi:hypothetical protein EV356DRAFT_501634 [Viridothelium virens]|uniref:G-patch domain-containing protein n=1 Tax=Viridothelium virens TaxID=1048519 RepID=A0A6A6H8Q3_VIRVR|nr:hypothetical protein EV356DRAFT_501634 [Viridothelium virens]
MAPTAAQDEEDDYMTMLIPDDAVPRNETSIQRRARKQREAEQRAHPKTKSELEREARETRDSALSSSILTSNPDNKGAKMMAKLGYKTGPLGAGGDPNARMEPISLAMKEDKSGIGHISEAKRKFREEAEALKIDMKKRKVNEEEFQERVRAEQQEKRMEGQLWAAMKIAEKLEGPEESVREEEKPGSDDESKLRPLTSIPVVWRELVRRGIEQDRQNHAQRMMRESLPQARLSVSNNLDEDEDEDDAQAFGTVEEEIEEEDPELDQFNALYVGDRLDKVIAYLREKNRYCFWCKYQYPNEEMEGCPGLTEDEHG